MSININIKNNEHEHNDGCGGACASCGQSCGLHTHGAKKSVAAEVNVGVSEIASAREARATRQSELLNEYCTPVVCFTMNIAGPIKYSKAIELCFNVGCEEYLRAIAVFNLRPEHTEYNISSTGCEAFFCIKGNAKLLKAAAVKVEELYDYSRLFDIDVIGTDGVKLSRRSPRKCLICNEGASVCARSRAHTLDELSERTKKLLREAAAYAASRSAYSALIEEVATTPKAGLVDMNNSGANSDMDVNTFKVSADTLVPFYYAIAYAAASDSVDNETLMDTLCTIGIEAEKAMLEATGGVNTHKGAIFGLGLLCAAVGSLSAKGRALDTVSILERAGELACARKYADGDTNGREVIRCYGDAVGDKPLGADAEARRGFPTAMAAYRRILGFKMMGMSDNDAYALSLVGIMAEIYDTNAYRRGGSEGADFVRRRAVEISNLPLPKRIPEILRFDEELISRNINCGGAADMLAVAIFMDKLTVYTACRDMN